MTLLPDSCARMTLPADSCLRMTLPAEFYERPVLDVAHDLIGCVVEHRGISGAIVETEAYHESEPACHAFTGLTARTRVLFADPGLAYVYRSYGIHALLNAVCEPPGVGAAVLIRALHPLCGLERMRAHRGRERAQELCSGPGKLTQALGIELGENSTALTGGGPIEILPPLQELSDAQIAQGTRIGITRAMELPWRFSLAGNPHVSRPWPTDSWAALHPTPRVPPARGAR